MEGGTSNYDASETWCLFEGQFCLRARFMSQISGETQMLEIKFVADP